MAGIYIHVPFCMSRCHYCDFFKSTKLQFREQYLQKLLEELAHRRGFFKEDDDVIQTIYFGGGTPSLISEGWLDKILQFIFSAYKVVSDPEITIEVNPDDLSPEYLIGLKGIGINRLSLGIQSFFDDDLMKMGRRHDAKQSRQILPWVFNAGFENVGVDLIYGLPWSGQDQLIKNLLIVDQYPIKHLSAYHLTIEPGTRFGEDKSQNKLSELSGSESERQFWLLHDKTEKMGFEHYEISNFAREGYYSRHNTSYWNGSFYLGAGPGAHSFDGMHRYWNKADLHLYTKEGYLPGLSHETLTEKDRFNEKLMLGLRKREGLDISDMMDNFSKYWHRIQLQIYQWMEKGFLESCDGRVFSTRKGWFVIDGIIEDLFIVE